MESNGKCFSLSGTSDSPPDIAEFIGTTEWETLSDAASSALARLNTALVDITNVRNRSAYGTRIEARMVDLQKAGGIAALVEALAYAVGFVVMATLLDPGNTEGWRAAETLAFVLERKAIFQTWNLFIWVLLISVASLRSDALPMGLIYLGFVVGLAGMLTVVPVLGEMGAVFGLGQIVWFAWIGVFMLRGFGTR